MAFGKIRIFERIDCFLIKSSAYFHFGLSFWFRKELHLLPPLSFLWDFPEDFTGTVPPRERQTQEIPYGVFPCVSLFLGEGTPWIFGTLPDFSDFPEICRESL